MDCGAVCRVCAKPSNPLKSTYDNFQQDALFTLFQICYVGNNTEITDILHLRRGFLGQYVRTETILQAPERVTFMKDAQ
jgi:hypothetical protein